MRLQTPYKIRILPRKLYLKAKQRCHEVQSRGANRFSDEAVFGELEFSGFAGFSWGLLRVPDGEASRKAGCGKSARPV